VIVVVAIVLALIVLDSGAFFLALKTTAVLPGRASLGGLGRRNTLHCHSGARA